MRDESVGQWLGELGSAAPTPGGGGAAALSAALGAALVEMVGNLSVGRREGEEDASLRASLERAGELRQRAVGLAEDDATVFAAVLAAYKLPKGDEREVADRKAAIQAALAGAARVPMDTAAAAAEVLSLCAAILPLANPNVLSDVAVAATAARAALDASVVNVEVNLAGLRDEARRAELARELRRYASGDLQAEADRVVAEVRRRIGT